MPSEMRNPVLAGTGDREKPDQRQSVTRENSPHENCPQDVIARIPKSRREEIWLAVRLFNGVAKLEVRIYELDGERNWRPTERQFAIPKSALLPLRDSLLLAEAHL